MYSVKAEAQSPAAAALGRIWQLLAEDEPDESIEVAWATAGSQLAVEYYLHARVFCEHAVG
jgi:hypothetical protein